MSERALLKKVNDLKALEAQKKAIEKRVADIQEDIKKEFNAKAFTADHPNLYQKYMGQSQTMRFTVQ